MFKRKTQSVPLHSSCHVVIQSVLAVALLAGSQHISAQQEIPDTISPLRVETDHNGVNVVSGKTQMRLPVLSVPAAPNLHFDRVQNAAPHMSGMQWGGPVQANFSVHTIDGTSESFRCPGFDCASLTGTGSVFIPGANIYWRGGSGERYQFDLKQVQTSGTNPVTMRYYASSVTYPNGEVITFDYDTETLPGDPLQSTFYRPNKLTSNLGYFISISYHSSDLQAPGWGSPAQAALHKSSAPTVPLRKLTYSQDGSTIKEITDLGERVFTCQGCPNSLGASLERSTGTFQFPGETSPAIQASAVPGHGVVGSVTQDGVQWNYSYANLQLDSQAKGYLYSKLTVTGPHGYNTVYDLQPRDERNVISRITDSIGRVTEVDFDDAYRLREIVYPEGNKVSVVYDIFGNLISRTMLPKPGSGMGAVTETAHYPTSSCSSAAFDVLCNRPSWYRDALNRQTDFSYNANGQLTEQIDPADADGVRRRTIITYETNTGLSRRSVVRVCGHSSTCGTPGEIRTEYEYWGSTFLPTVERRIDAAASEILETHYSYDEAGRLLVEDGPLPGTTDARYYRYDEYGRRSWEIGPADGSGVRLAQRFHYRDSDDKVMYVEEGSVPSATSTSLTVFRRIDHAYDNRRNPERESVSAGSTIYAVAQRTFDQRGRLECEAHRMNPAAFTSLPGNACTLGAAGDFGPDRITRHVYDAADQLLKVQRAYGTPLQQDYATYTYTPNGQRKTVKDANNNLSTFEYDGFDRLSKLRFPVATKGANQSSTTDYEQYGYDAVGNRTSLRKRDGRTISFSYDALNRLRVKSVPTSASGSPGYSVYSGYDVQGLLTYARFGSDSGAGISNTYDGFGRLILSSSNLGGVTRNVASVYDANGNRTRITHPDGEYFEYAWDPAGRLIHLSENGPSATLASIFYDGEGRREELARDTAGSITAYGYDPVSRLEALSHDLDGAGTGSDVEMGFAWSPASQIVSRSLSNTAYEHPIANAVRSYAVNGRNQYTEVGGATHTWDANGNLTSDGATSFGYDTENRLVSASGAKGAALVYDPLGRLYEVATPSGVTRFVYDGDRLIAEYSGSGTVLRRYVHGPGVDEPLLWYEGSSVSAGNRRYLHANHQGSIVAISGASGGMLQVNTYDAYGITGASNTARFQYTGQAAIPELGLHYYKARFYSAELGRFLQTDPIGYDDQLNLYAYVGNDPVNNADPSGKVSGAVVKIVKLAYKGGDLAATFAGAAEDAKTLFSADASAGERALAAVSLATEIASPISLREGKAAAGAVAHAAKGRADVPNSNLPVPIGERTAIDVLGGPAVTPGGRTITDHAARQMRNPPPGRVQASPLDVDAVLDGGYVRKRSFPASGETLTIRNNSLPGSPDVVVDSATGNRVITVIKREEF